MTIRTAAKRSLLKWFENTQSNYIYTLYVTPIAPCKSADRTPNDSTCGSWVAQTNIFVLTLRSVLCLLPTQDEEIIPGGTRQDAPPVSYTERAADSAS